MFHRWSLFKTWPPSLVFLIIVIKASVIISMSKVFVLLIICICSVCLVCAQPKLEVAGGLNQDFGNAYSGWKKVSHVLIVRNRGLNTLELHRVEATCGCTAALTSSRSIPPGDSSKITVNFTIGSYRGKVTKNVRVVSNDPADSTLFINFSLNILDVLQSEPIFFYFDSIKADTPATKLIHLTNATASPVFIFRTLYKDSSIRALRLGRRKLRPGEKTDLTLTVVPRHEGYFQGELVLKTDFKEAPDVYLSYMGVVRKKSDKQ